jgi:hypothetical protein
VQVTAAGHLPHRVAGVPRQVVQADRGVGGGHRGQNVAVLVDQPDAAARGAERRPGRADHDLRHLGLGRRRGQVRDDLLQHADAALRGLRGAARGEQLALVPAALGRVEDGGPHDPRQPGRVPAQDGVDQRGQPAAVLADHVERDLVHVVLHPQQRRVVGLVVDLTARGEQVAEAAPADQLRAGETGPD